MPRHGLLLVNLGTPAAPTPPAVREYLREFLSDPRVVKLPRWLWLPILHGIVLRTRPAKSAAIGAPTGIAVSPSGELFIAAGALRKVSKNGSISTLYEATYPAYDVAIGSDGTLYVASIGGRVLEGRPVAPPILTLPGNGK